MKIKCITVLLFLVFINIFTYSEDFILHEVKKDETVWRISKNYNVRVEDICKINNITDISKVGAGTKLKIPAKNKHAEISQKSESYKVHILQKGETIWQLSRIYKLQPDDICKYNKIENISVLKPGEKIKIPFEKKENEPAENSADNNTDAKGEYFKHSLKKGETLWAISKKYKTDINEICRLNKISDITKIKTGFVLVLPLKVEYLDYKIPLEGEINLFKTAHFRGIHIFTEEDSTRRNVLVVEKGEVSYIDTIPGYGLSVFIKHDNGLLSTYSGLDAVAVKKGDKVKENDLLGIAGKLSRYERYGILFSIQEKGYGLAFDIKKQKFYKS